MSSIRTRTSNIKSSKKDLRSIRIHSTNPYPNRTQNIVPASSRYNNGSERNGQNNSVQDLNVSRLLEQEDFLDDESFFLERESLTEEESFFLERESYEDNILENEPLFESFQSKLIEERNSHEICNGDYGPYFPNATTFMLFTWCIKHMISKYI